MEMNDNTILRIKVPAHLYEAVKAQLTIDEGKHNFGTKDMKPVKGQKAAGASSDKPKKTSAPKAKAPKKAEAPKKEVPKDGHKKVEKKPRSIEELKAAYEALGQMISEMEDEGKAPVEEAKEEKVEESKWGREEYMDEPDYDEERGAFVKYAPKKKFRPKYVPKGQSTMSAGDIGYSSLSKFDPSKEK
jgi:hypothetical protein